MQRSIEYIEDENYFLINKKIKIDTKYINNLIGKRNLEDLIKLEDNLYYYKKKTLIEILFNIDNYKKVKFINNDTDDYRFNNLQIKLRDIIKFNEPPNVTILEYGTPKLISAGAYSGQYRNMYWKVKDLNNNEYYIMHINNDTFTKFSSTSLNKILNFEDCRPSWYLNLNGYIASSFKINDEKKCIYLHQYIMDVHFDDNTDMKKTVDHINRDKMDNRRENLRFANMSDQNSNRDKKKRQQNACELPNGIKQSDLPIYVCYNKRCYDKENNSWREFFTIENHPKLDKTWATSKSNTISIKEKLNQAKIKIKHLNGEITDEEYKKITEPEFKLFKGLRLTIDKKYNKYKFDYENRTIKPSINYKMILTHNDLQLMIDKMIDLINNKYKENKEFTKLPYYKLEKPVLLDFSNVNNEIIDIVEDCTAHNSKNVVINTTISSKYTNKPDLPANFLLCKEKETYYLAFSKYINTIRYNKKIAMKCMCIQTELDRLIDEINEAYPDLNIPKYTVKNPYDFIDKTQKENNKPILPDNFCICHLTGKDYIQFSKTINGKKISYKTVIKSYDLQKELDNFVNYLNQEYKLNITEQKVIDLSNWKTINKVK
jgi:hypothetical protein